MDAEEHAVFGVAASMARPKATAAAATYPCSGPRDCNCCVSGCSDYNGACGSGVHCWTHQENIGGGCYHLYSCCDYNDGGGLCVCLGDKGVYC